MQINGQANKWTYKYSAGGLAVDYYFHATANEVLFDSTSNIILDGESLIAQQWFDSDEAMKIAEDNGGKEFRNNKSEYTIEVSLYAPLVPNSVTYWFVKYKSQIGRNRILHLGINTLTRETALYY